MLPSTPLPEPQSALAARILAQPGPVLLLDTCSVLDIIRQPLRINIPSGTISAAIEIELRSRPGAGRTWVIVSELVAQEWSDHAAKTSQEVESSIRKTERDLAQILAAASRLPIMRPLPAWGLSSLQLHHELHDVAAQLMGCAAILASEQSHILDAHRRLINGFAPAKKGKQEYKDSVIIEQYLGLCRDLRLAGFSEKCVFVSSNTDDYGTPARLLPPLDQDFPSVGLILAVNLDHALSAIP